MRNLSFFVFPTAVSILLVFLFFPTISFSSPPDDDAGLSAFLSQVKEAAEARDTSRYISHFLPDIRDREEAYFTSMFQDLEMESLRIFLPSTWSENEGNYRIFAQALFENSFSVLIHIWHFNCVRRDGGWVISDKTVTSHVSSLYKMAIPNGRVERVKSFHVTHRDIDIQFENSLVFFDNLPGLETGIIVFGRGRIRYAPSVDREKHQLELALGKDRLEDRLKHIYLRFSNSFFEKNVRIVRDDNLNQEVTDSDRNQAYSIFAKYYSRSFTLRDSLTGQLMTMIPSGDEAVFEVEGADEGTFTYIFSPYSEEEISLYQWKNERIVNLYSPDVEGGGKRMSVTFDEMFDVKNYEIDIDFNPSNSYISGRAQVHFESTMGTLEQIKFKFNSDLEILRIYDEEKNPLFYSFDRLRDLLYVYFLRPVKRSETSSIEVYYRGILLPPRQVSDVISGPQYGEAGSVTFISPPKLDTYLYSQAAFWYPATADEDYFLAQVKVIVPPKYKVVSNGELIENSTIDELKGVEDLDEVGRAVFVHKTRVPVKYLSFIAGQFGRPKIKEGKIPVLYFRTEEILPQNMNYLEEAAAIMEFYQERFGEFPFDKLGIVHRQWSHSGGHSPASFVILNELPRFPGIDPLIEKNNPVTLSRYREYYLAHEIAHQWWGQAVAWRTYHDQWISEGLSQYSAALYLREKYGEGAFNYILKKFSRWTRKKTKWGGITMGSRISYFDFSAYQTIVYNKSSLVLNMLREILGDELFFAGINQFYRKYRYSIARTGDFYKVMQDTSKQDLMPFFDNWFNSYLLPDVTIAHMVEKKSDGYILNVTVNQSKKTFVFPLWIQWNEKGEIHSRMLIVKDKVQRFHIQTAGKPGKFKVNTNDIVPGRFR